MAASRIFVLLGLGLAFATPFIGSVRADDTADQLKRCRSVSDIAARAACYDRVVDNLATAPRAATLPPPAVTAQRPTPPTAPAAPAPGDRFGEKDLSFKQRVPEEQRPPDELVLRVTGVRTDAVGNGTFTLENGQVWRQMEASSLRISNGARVKLRSGTMGVYYLSLESGNKSFRVKRLN